MSKSDTLVEHSVDGPPHGSMGTPQIIVYGLPCQFDSCHGLLMVDQDVASMKSMAYLTELEEPSQLAAVSMPDGLEFPS
jgi:hypothetical protein